MKKVIQDISNWLTARPSLERSNNFRLSLAHRALGINNYRSDIESGEEFWIKHYISQFNPSIIFDVGAHKGEYAQIIRENGFQGQLHLFEPHPQTFDILSKNMLADEKTHLHKFGFSNESGSTELFDYSTQGENSGSPHATLYEAVITDMHKGQKAKGTKINLETIDGFMQTHNLSFISLLKIDTEGNEFKVLQGAKETIKNGKIQCIQFEFGEMNVVSRVFFKDFFDLLSPSYDIFRLLPDGLLPIQKYDARYHEIFVYQNIIALPKK